MPSYTAFDEDVQINGRTVLTVVEEAMGEFSEKYRDRAVTALAEEGIENPEPDQWYSQQAWLDAFERIGTELEPHIIDRIGEQIPSVADWPSRTDTVPEGLRAIDDAYQRNHRGGEIGSYQFDRVDDRIGTVTCHNPYPCPFDRGLIRGVAKQYAPVDAVVFVEETGETCRRDGDEVCSYTVHW